MRQEEKQAAAAARELLKADALREKRKAAATTTATGKKRKAAAAAEQMRSGRDPHVPEQNGAGTPPQMSFIDGSCFFNSAGSFFGGSPNAHPWQLPSDPATWDQNPTPPGGFTNLMHPHVSQNFHFTGGPSHFVPFKPPRSMQEPPAPMENTEHVTVDSGDELPRTEKRILWTQAEDVKMMSSWLHNSTDPSIGADRKNEQYWNDVVETYNETTPSNRRRNAKQIKDRFHKVNRWTDLFHSAWLKARMIYTSGYNDQMWIEKAHVFYVEDNKKLNLGPFVLMEVWNTVKTEAKWITYNSGLKAARKRAATKGSRSENEVEAGAPIDLEELDDQPRPMGQKQAKKLKYTKSKQVDVIDVEELDKFAKIQDEQNANRLKVLEVQQKLSTEKMEQTKLAHLAAKEQKEARKFELESRMFETYNHLLSMD